MIDILKDLVPARPSRQIDIKIIRKIFLGGGFVLLQQLGHVDGDPRFGALGRMKSLAKLAEDERSMTELLQSKRQSLASLQGELEGQHGLHHGLLITGVQGRLAHEGVLGKDGGHGNDVSVSNALATAYQEARVLSERTHLYLCSLIEL